MEIEKEMEKYNGQMEIYMMENGKKEK